MKYSVFIFLLCSNLIFSQSTIVNNVGQTEIYLWNNKIPDGPGPTGFNQISKKGSLTNISVPKLLVSVPANPKGVAVLVISGGGYAHIELGNEGDPAAKWLQKLGITVFELEYRLPQENWSNREVPFQDAQRALRIIRSKASEYKIDTNKIGILGFSAGGHLAGYISSTYTSNFYPLQDSIDSLYSAKPNFCGLIYPVISMLPPNNHTHSYRSLLGNDKDKKDLQIKYSVEKQVGIQTPPTFLAHAVDDSISHVENSILMFNALKGNHIPVEIHIFQSGGHGWGLGKENTDTVMWPQLFEHWLRMNHII